MSVVILATGLLLIIEGMGRSQQVIRVGENLVFVAQFAEEKINEAQIKSKQYEKLPTGSERGTEKLPGKEFHWQTSVQIFDHPSIETESELNRVNVLMTWTEGAYRNNEFNLESLILNQSKKLAYESG